MTPLEVAKETFKTYNERGMVTLWTLSLGNCPKRAPYVTIFQLNRHFFKRYHPQKWARSCKTCEPYFCQFGHKRALYAMNLVFGDQLNGVGPIWMDWTHKNVIWAIILSVRWTLFWQYLSCRAKMSKHRAKINAYQFWHILGLKFGQWDILDLANRFLRYREIRSVSDGHSAPLEKQSKICW